MFSHIIQNSWKYILLIVLLIFPLFAHLGSITLRLWDESRLAVNAYEMYKNGNYLVTYFDGSPDMWNTKPPFLIGCQVLFMKLFGVNDVAVRLPSAIAACLTCFSLLIFSVRYLKSFWFGFIAAIVLVTCNGYVGEHASRTADYDALLTLFTTLSCMLFFAYTQTLKTKYIYLFFLFMTMGVLTKSSAALMFIPGLFLYTLFSKRLITLLKNKHLYIALLGFLMITLGYYILREAYNPGYIRAVLENELGGRFLEVIEGHQHDALFYYHNWVSDRLPGWIYILPCGFLFGIFSKNKKLKNMSVYCSFLLVSFIIVISSAQTKLKWYDVPMYPFMALLIAVFIYSIFSFLKENPFIKSYFPSHIVPTAFLFLVLIIPYKKIIQKSFHPQTNPYNEDLYNIGSYVREGLQGRGDWNQNLILIDGYNAPCLFYVYAMQEKGIDIAFSQKEKIKSGNIIIFYENSVKEYTEAHFDIEEIESYGNIKKYKILQEKNGIQP